MQGAAAYPRIAVIFRAGDAVFFGKSRIFERSACRYKNRFPLFPDLL
jgi:hypothetical protein